MTLLAQFGSVLEQFLASPDFKEAVISSTKAGWGGSGYSVEFFEGETWQVLWNNQIGNLYEPSGIIMSVPQLDEQDFSVAEAEGIDQEELLRLAFFAEEDDLKKEMRDALSNRSVMAEV